MPTSDYDASKAAHYAAYRPPLHELILGRLLTPETHFEVGLDVGCGTGYSTIALAPYCNAVIGIDPSPSMRKHAIRASTVTYLNGTAEAIPIAANSVNVVTCAGVLFYTQVESVLQELFRVCTYDSVVMVYDFEVDLSKALTELGLRERVTPSQYDHTINFSRTGVGGSTHTQSASANAQPAIVLEEDLVGRENVSIELSPVELCHVLLADSKRHGRLREHFPDDRSLEFALIGQRERHQVSVDVFFAKYYVRK